MKIAFISSASSVHVKKIANELTARHHEIVLFTCPNHLKLAKEFDKRIAIETLPFPSPFGYYFNAWNLRKRLLAGRFDLYNSHYASGYGTLSRLAGVHPLSLAVFGSDVFEYPYKSRWNMRTLVKNLDNADVITSTSRIMVDELRKFYRRNREIFVTPFGVDLNAFRPLESAHSTIFVFGTVKKIERIYGIDVLIKAFGQLCGELPDVSMELHIYGRGSAREEFQELCRTLGIADKVRFMGYIPNTDVPSALSTMDVACFPSVVDESFGVAVVEAMACGIPVIASDVAGFREVLGGDGPGVLVERKSVEALVQAMRQMYSLSSEDRRRMGMEGRKRALSFYDFKKNADVYLKAISTSLAR